MNLVRSKRRSITLTAATAFLAIVAIITGFTVGAGADEATTTTVPLHEAHRNSSFDTFQHDDTDCGGLDPANGPVWHFIANNLEDNTPAGTLTAYFGPAANTTTETETVDSSKVLKSTQHFYVQSTESVLVDAFAVFEGAQPDAKLVLSHVCGETPPPPPPTSNPSAEVSDECASDSFEGTGVTVTLSNTGDADATFTVDGGDDILVGPGNSVDVFVQVDEDANYSIEITVDGEHFTTLTGTRNCDENPPPPPTSNPSADVTEECASDSGQGTGVTVTLSNTGDADATFTVDGGPDIVVGPNDSVDVFVQVDEDANYSIDITVDGEPFTTLTGTRNCEPPPPPPSANPSATVSDACGEDEGDAGIWVKLSNTGDAQTLFTIEGNEVPLGPGDSIEVFVPVAEDAAYSIPVKADGKDLTTLTGTRNCEPPPSTPTTDPTQVLSNQVTNSLPTEVEGVQVTRALPRTGSDSGLLAELGLLLLALGGASIVVSRRVRTRRA